MTRYAIYFVPSPQAQLWRFGCEALGYDSVQGEAVPFHGHDFYQHAEIEEWTASPRRYGFHATLKPPFVLTEGKSVRGLEYAAADFCASRKAFTVSRLDVVAIGSFLALVPDVPSQKLNTLAADCVTVFEPWRAPLSKTDRARRLQCPLTDNQMAHLDTWGYPYVFDEFRFHMTLTGRLPGAVQGEALAALRALYAPIAKPVDINGIAICEQSARDARFIVRQLFMFSG